MEFGSQYMLTYILLILYVSMHFSGVECKFSLSDCKTTKKNWHVRHKHKERLIILSDKHWIFTALWSHYASTIACKSSVILHIRLTGWQMYFLRYGARILPSKCIPGQSNKSRGLRLNDISTMQKPVFRQIHFYKFVTYKISQQEKKKFQEVEYAKYRNDKN